MLKKWQETVLQRWLKLKVFLVILSIFIQQSLVEVTIITALLFMKVTQNILNTFLQAADSTQKRFILLAPKAQSMIIRKVQTVVAGMVGVTHPQ